MIDSTVVAIPRGAVDLVLGPPRSEGKMVWASKVLSVCQRREMQERGELSDASEPLEHDTSDHPNSAFATSLHCICKRDAVKE
jgi:hypothetical protein